MSASQRPGGNGSRLVVGVDLGGTNARAAVVDVSEGRIVAEKKQALPRGDKRPEDVADVVVELVAAVDERRLAKGVGVGFAGMLRGWSGVVVNAPNFGWREVDLRSLLAARLGRSVELYNDLAAITYGESQYGAARGSSHSLTVFVGTGIGSGLVVDGKLNFGATHLAGEIGHVKVAAGPSARACGCGQSGCIEAYASGANLAKRAREELAPATGNTSLAVSLAGSLEQVHAGHIDAAAAQGDPWASALWDEVAGKLGLVLANAVTLLNPEKLVMGGGVWQGAPELRRRVQASFTSLVNRASSDGFSIVDTTLGDDSGVLGAACLVADGIVAP